MTHVTDTHPLVWFLSSDARLSQSAEAALRHPSVRLVIPTLVLAEIGFLYAKHRIAIGVPTVLAHIAATPNCTLHSLDAEVVERLPSTLDIHDAVIVATALVRRDLLGENTALITRDAAIHASGLIPCIW